jgi:hypothetical protein
MNYIKTKFKTSVPLIEIKLSDFSYGTTAGTSEQQLKDIEMRGVEYPHVQINEYVFGIKEIKRCVIDSSGFLPVISLKVELISSGLFLSTSFPKDGDLLSVFIRGRDDLFIPIRNDYLITRVDSYTSDRTSQEGKNIIIDIEAELYVPHLYDEITYAFEGTSYNAIIDIAKKLKLGFASNEDDTDDSMKWICPMTNYKEFANEITSHSWKDKNSFFVVFIDVYYNLNFVNVNKLISYDADILTALGEDTNSGAGARFEKTQKMEIEKCFTNHPRNIRDNFFIKKFKPINKSSNLSNTFGYAFNSVLYDHIDKKKWQLQSKSIITDNVDQSKIILRGRSGDNSYQELQKYNFVGVQNTKNVHKMYLYAVTHNLMNNVEMEKINVEIDLNKFNFNIYRYENVPAIFFVINDTRRIQTLTSGESENDMSKEGQAGIAVDRFYTGYYLIKGIRITYAPSATQKTGNSAFSESLILSRREWPSPTGK